jgi:hypothetical protein
MNDRWPRLWQVGVLALVVVLVVASIRAVREENARSRQRAVALLAAPADAWLVVTVDLAAARPLVEPTLRSAGGLATATRAAGLGPLSDACGFDPVSHLRELMVAAPEAGERGDFGVAFSADLTVDELATCARKAIGARGGVPSTSTRGDFIIIGDGSAPGQARLAYRQGGPFLVGRGAWLDAMIDAAEGRALRAASRHDALRAALAPAGAPARALIVTALLPKSLRDHVRAETDAGPGGAFAGVLGVAEAGAAVTASPSSTAVDVELRCDAANACDEVKVLIETGRRDLSGNFAARLMGFGPLIDSLAVEVRSPTTLALTARAPTADLAQALERIISSFSARPPAGGPRGAPTPVEHDAR